MISHPKYSFPVSKCLLLLGSIILLVLVMFYKYNFIISNNTIYNYAVGLKTKQEIQIKNVTVDLSKTSILLQDCSNADFVKWRAKKRIASDKHAVFVQGDRVINLGDNYYISVDDILYGYDVLFEKDNLFSAGSWLGAQFQSSPEDAMVLQQLIWRIKPDLIIDFGTNVGGSALFFASIMSFYNEKGLVLTIDTKPYTQNWVSHDRVKCKDCVNPADNNLWKKYVKFIQGSTTDPNIIAKIKNYALNATKIFISHDSAHDTNTIYHDLLNYAELVSINSYFLVQDTKLDRILNPFDGPLKAVRKFLDYQKKTQNLLNYTYEVDRSVEIFYYSQHAHGWLKRIK